MEIAAINNLTFITPKDHSPLLRNQHDGSEQGTDIRSYIW